MRHKLSFTGYNAVTSTTTNTPRPADLYDTRLAEPVVLNKIAQIRVWLVVRAAPLSFGAVTGLLSDSVGSILPRCEASDATIPPMDERAAAQAVELVRALRDQLHEMTRRLTWLERQGVNGTNGRASAIRCEAAALRRDIHEAQIHVDRLEHRYLNGDGHAQPRLPENRAFQ